MRRGRPFGGEKRGFLSNLYIFQWVALGFGPYSDEGLRHFKDLRQSGGFPRSHGVSLRPGCGPRDRGWSSGVFGDESTALVLACVPQMVQITSEAVYRTAWPGDCAAPRRGSARCMF
jgi:hypothetical protein